jgi:uncharacterized membrane protein HdeD (DUF308 family)
MFNIGRIIIGVLSLALGLFAIKEIIVAPNFKLAIIAVMLLIMAIMGIVESCQKYNDR